MTKRLLMIAAAMVLAAGSYAQPQKARNMKMDAQQPAMSISISDELHYAAEAGVPSVAPRKTPADNGMYYEKPAGSLYVGWNFEGSGYGPTYFAVPPFQEAVMPYHFTPSLLVKNPTWELRYPNAEATYDVSDWAVTDDSIFVIPEMYPLQSYAMPTMILGLSEYVIANDGYYYKQYPNNYYPRISTWDGTVAMTPYHDHSDENINYIGWSGFNKSHFLFGSGSKTESYVEEETGDTITGVDCPITSIFMMMGTTPGPLYIESAFCDVLSWLDEPIAEGKEVTLTFYNPETQDVYGQMTTTLEDMVINDSYPEGYSTDYGTMWFFKTLFANWQEDEFGSLYSEPVVVDGPWAIEISGLDQEGVSFGMRGCQNMDDDIMPDGYAVVELPNGETRPYHYTSHLSFNVTFNAMFDGVKVIEADSINGEWCEEVNVLKLSDDGTTVSNEGVSELNGALVYTAMPQYGYGEDAEGNYYLLGAEDEDAEFNYDTTEDLPEWITDMTVDVSGWEEGYGQTIVSFVGEPLPTECAGRMAILYIEGKGVVSEAPIIVYQGDRTASVNSVEAKVIASKARYNLAGQRVGKNYKGIVIENGKKFFAK